MLRRGLRRGGVELWLLGESKTRDLKYIGLWVVASEKHVSRRDGDDLEGGGALWRPGGEGEVRNEKWKRESQNQKIHHSPSHQIIISLY